MPNRLVREGFLDSQPIHNLTDPAECFYHRLLLAADDAGRMDGRLEVLRARLFPLDSSRRASDVEKQLRECVSEGLVIPYEWKSQPYVQVTKVQRSSPAVVSKFPWSDGSFRITYVRVDTRDGEKEFVESSLAKPMRNPSPSLRDPSEPDPRECTETETETETKAETVEAPPLGRPSQEHGIPRNGPSSLLYAWNQNRGPLSEAKGLSGGREKHARARLSEVPELARWAAAVRRMAASSFCRGENDRGWKADFDFLLKPDSLVKIEEGKYDDRKASQPVPVPHGDPDWLVEERRKVAIELAESKRLRAEKGLPS